MPSIPDLMTAIEITQPGGPEVLRPAKIPVPRPAAGEVLIRVAAAGVNRPDVLQRMGRYPPPPGASDIPGLEVAGEIVALGEGVASHSVGGKVCALVAGGGYAQYVSAPAVQCLPIPANTSLEEAACLPETFFTVYFNVFERAQLRAGETLLVHGGSSGIGTTAILMAKAMGATVLATAGTAEKCAACVGLGAARAINYREEDFVAAVKHHTNGAGANVILDMVGGTYLARNIAAAAVDGRIACIATQGGATGELDLRLVLTKRLTLTASTLRAQPIGNKGRLASALLANVWPLFENHRLTPPIYARFALTDARQAHELMDSGTHIGKLVLIA